MINFQNNLKLSNYAVLRKEHFGGLLFNKKDKSISELNQASYSLLFELKGGCPINQIIEKVESLGITTEEVVGFLKELASMELICNG